jgi:hypothetical protein
MFAEVRMIGLETISKEIEEIQNMIAVKFTWDLSEVSKGK